MNNGYLPHEGKETDGNLKAKTVMLTERQIEEIEELVMEFRRGGLPVASFSAFIRLAIHCGLGEATNKMVDLGGFR